MKKRMIKAVLSMSLGITMLSAASVYADPNEIYIYSKTKNMDAGLKAATEAYSASHPDVTFVLETNENAYTTNLKAKFSGGSTEPTLFMVQGTAEIATWQEYLMDMTEAEWADQMVDGAKESASYDGKIYGFPLSTEASYYLYNKDIFEACGIDTLPTTLEELDVCFKTIQDAGYGVISEEYGDFFQGGNFVMSMGIARQEDPMAFIEGLNNGTETIAGNEHFLELADWIQVSSSYDPMALNTDYTAQMSRFCNGDAAVILGGTWTWIEVNEVNPDLRMGIMGAPLNNDPETNGKIYVACSPYFVVNNDSEAAQAGADFLNWLALDEEGKEFLSKGLNSIPAFQGMEADAASIGEPGEECLAYMQEGKSYGMYTAYLPDGGPQLFGETVQKLVAGMLDAQAFTEELQADWESLVR